MPTDKAHWRCERGSALGVEGDQESGALRGD